MRSSSAAVTNGVVYVGSTSMWTAEAHAYLYAFNATTPAVKWRYWAGVRGTFSSSPAVSNGIVYVGTDIYRVEALDAETCMPVWNYTVGYGNSVVSSPAVAKGVVYVGVWIHGGVPS